MLNRLKTEIPSWRFGVSQCKWYKKSTLNPDMYESNIMGMPRFKMHVGVQSTPEAMQRRLVMLFCLQCQGELKRLNDNELRCALRISQRQPELTKKLFLQKGFVDENPVFIDWEKSAVSDNGRF